MKLVSHDQTVSYAQSVNRKVSCGWDNRNISLMHLFRFPELTLLSCLNLDFPYSNRDMADLEH